MFKHAALILIGATISASVAAQAPGTSAAALLRLEPAAAIQEIARRPADAAAALDLLRERFDASIHSARDVPQQRLVRYDADALRDGLALSQLYRDATSDDRPFRTFRARQDRIDGTVLLNRREYADAIAKLDTALAEAERLDDVWLQIITRINLAYGYLETGQGEKALEVCERARQLAERADERAKALVVFNLASARMHTGDFAAAIPLAEETIRLSQKLGNRLWEGNARLNLGVAHLELGHTPEARTALTAARDVLLKTRDRLGMGRAMYNLAIAEASDEAFAQAVAEMERALPLIRAVDIRHSHSIEENADEYYNTIEESALRLLVDWHERLGNPAQINAYLKELTALRAKRPATAGHHHKPGS